MAFLSGGDWKRMWGGYGRFDRLHFDSMNRMRKWLFLDTIFCIRLRHRKINLWQKISQPLSSCFH